LSYEANVQTPGPTMTISTAADCNGLPSGWIRSFCALTLRPDWQAIIGPTDPLPDPADGTDSVTWFASLARAEIDGDTTLCSDVAMRMWITMGSGLGGAPPPGATPTPVHPIAACLDSFRRTAAAGSFTVDGPAYHVTAQQLATDTVQVFENPAAVARAAGGTAPTFDPYLVCDLATVSRDVCDQLVAAVTTTLGSRQSGVQTIRGSGALADCPGSSSSCPPPAAGSWLGGVLASTGSSTGYAFNVAEAGGQLTVVEVPFKP
jgi:hypothetical protein